MSFHIAKEAGKLVPVPKTLESVFQTLDKTGMHSGFRDNGQFDLLDATFVQVRDKVKMLVDARSNKKLTQQEKTFLRDHFGLGDNFQFVAGKEILNTWITSSTLVPFHPKEPAKKGEHDQTMDTVEITYMFESTPMEQMNFPPHIRRTVDMTIRIINRLLKRLALVAGIKPQEMPKTIQIRQVLSAPRTLFAPPDDAVQKLTSTCGRKDAAKMKEGFDAVVTQKWEAVSIEIPAAMFDVWVAVPLNIDFDEQQATKLLEPTIGYLFGHEFMHIAEQGKPSEKYFQESATIVLQHSNDTKTAAYNAYCFPFLSHMFQFGREMEPILTQKGQMALKRVNHSREMNALIAGLYVALKAGVTADGEFLSSLYLDEDTETFSHPAESAMKQKVKELSHHAAEVGFPAQVK